MNKIQREFCEEKGLVYIRTEGSGLERYIHWLEAKVNDLRQKEVESKSEDLVNFLTWYIHNSDYGKIGEPIKAIVDDYIKFKNK